MNKLLPGIFATLFIFSLRAISAPTDTAASDIHKTVEKKEIVKASAADKTVEPITGAFGIQLGEHFETSMVAKVLSKQEQTYNGQGAKLKATLFHVEPSEPDERFQQYSIKTSDAGIIYTIQGDYQYEVKSDKTKPEGKGKGAGKPGNKKPATAIQKTCKAAVKTMAGELEARYGKPRGQGWDGLWYTFRQISETSNRGLKLYGHRCRSGMYSIIYTDEKVQRAMLPGKASTPATSSTPAKP